MKRKEENNSIYNGIKENKISRNKLKQESERLYTENHKILVKKLERT